MSFVFIINLAGGTTNNHSRDALVFMWEIRAKTNKQTTLQCIFTGWPLLGIAAAMEHEHQETHLHIYWLV